MTGLPPEAEELLAQARASHGPSDDDRKRMLTSLHATLGIASAVPLVSAASSAAALGEGSGAVAALKGAGAAKGLGALFGYKATKLVLATVLLGGATSVAVLPELRGGVARRAAPRSESPAAMSDAEHAPVDQAPALGAYGPRTAEGTAAEAAADPRDAREASGTRENIGTREATPDLRSPAESPASTASAPATVQAEHAEKYELATAGTPTSRPRVSTAREHTRRARHRADRATGVRNKGTSQVASVAGSAAASSLATPATTTAAVAEAKLAANTAEAKPAEAPGTSDELAAIATTAAQQQAPRELALIRRALTSLRDHQAGGALALLGEHEQRYPNGVFATEREGLRAIALCAAGKLDEGKRARASFLRTSGEVPIAARVKRACQDKP
jgi:hypothetical protein